MLEQTITLIFTAGAGLANFFLAFYVYIKGPDKRINRNFSALCFVLFMWCSANLLVLIFKDVFWVRITYVAGTLIALSTIYFSCALAEIKLNKILTILVYSSTTFFFFASFLPSMVKSISYAKDYSTSVVLGPLFNGLTIYFIFSTCLIVYILIKALLKSDKHRKIQIQYFIFGLFIFIFFVMLNGVILPFLGFTQFFSLDTPSTLFITGFASYAIIKYHVLGIKSFLFKIFINTMLLVLVMGLLAAIIFLESWVQNNFGITGFYLMIFLVSIIILLIARSWFIKTKDLENTKIILTESLRISEEEREKTMAIISNFNDGLLVFNGENKITIVNPAAEKIFNLRSASLVGKTIYELGNFVGIDPTISSFLKEDSRINLKKKVVISKNLFLEILNIPLYLNEKIIGGLIILHDVTDTKRIENMKNEFVSLAAHQLRTPLSAIKWSLELVLNNYFGEINKEQKEILSKTHAKNDNLITIVNDLLSVAKIEDGRYIYSQNLNNLQEIFESMMNQYLADMKNKNIKFEFEKSSIPLPEIMVDREKIKIPFQNLLENAIKYTGQNGEIKAKMENNGEEIEFKITDSGIGIPAGEQKRLFEKFFRASNAVKVDPAGSGLGLFITKNIIEAHGGTIYFNSEENKGTTFGFKLPINK